MIDIHCHVLPDVDDGAKSWDISLEMCRMAAQDGIEHLVATPHANDRYCYDREQLAGLVTELRQKSGGRPRLSLGCDFHLSYDNFEDLLVRPEKYLIEGSRTLLVELSNYSIPVNIDACFSRMIEMGILPVLTHPERNPILQRTPERVLRWVDEGCAVQITAGVLTGLWGERAWRAAEWLFQRHAVHIVATDAHDTKRRIPVLSAARNVIEDDYGRDVARALVEDNPRAAVSGQPLPYFPNPLMK